MSKEWKKVEAGRYVWNIGYGYNAIVQKVSGGWKWIVKNEIGVVAHGQEVKLISAKVAAYHGADKVEIEDINIMSKKAFKHSPNLPWCCNPAGETYWSM